MDLKKLLYDTCRTTLGVVFLSSGIGKFYGTSGIIGPGYMFEELAKHNLLLFAIFIALAELIIGYLLLVKRFATLGAVMLLPMIANILVVVISLQWQGTPLVDSVFLAMNIYLLYYDRKKLYPILGLEEGSQLAALIKQTAFYILGLLVITSGVLLSHYVDTQFRLLTRLGLLIFLISCVYGFYKRRRKSEAPQ